MMKTSPGGRAAISFLDKRMSYEIQRFSWSWVYSKWSAQWIDHDYTKIIRLSHLFVFYDKLYRLFNFFLNQIIFFIYF